MPLTLVCVIKSKLNRDLSLGSRRKITFNLFSHPGKIYTVTCEPKNKREQSTTCHFVNVPGIRQGVEKRRCTFSGVDMLRQQYFCFQNLSRCGNFFRGAPSSHCLWRFGFFTRRYIDHTVNPVFFNVVNRGCQIFPGLPISLVITFIS